MTKPCPIKVQEGCNRNSARPCCLEYFSRSPGPSQKAVLISPGPPQKAVLTSCDRHQLGSVRGRARRLGPSSFRFFKMHPDFSSFPSNFSQIQFLRSPCQSPKECYTAMYSQLKDIRSFVDAMHSWLSLPSSRYFWSYLDAMSFWLYLPSLRYLLILTGLKDLRHLLSVHPLARILRW